MAEQSRQVHLDIPNFGQVPVQLSAGPTPTDPVTITHATPLTRGPSTGPVRETPAAQSTDSAERGVPAKPVVPPGMDFLGPDIVRIIDPASQLLRYAVLRQKIVTLPTAQINQLIANPTRQIGIIGPKDGVDTFMPYQTLIQSDYRCPAALAKDVETVLLSWPADVVWPNPFPDAVFFDLNTKAVTPLAPDQQTNNFVLSSDDGGPHSPPPHPPWDSALSAQPSTINPLTTQLKKLDFKLATLDDIQHYKQATQATGRPSVAVLDTGLKFNISTDTAYEYGPYSYPDADGIRRQFTLSHPDLDRPLGYCALLAYQQTSFLQLLQAKAGQDLVNSLPFTAENVTKSPYDDYQLFDDAAETQLLDARHGSTVTALIQQNGDDAPVVPVKVFDNVGRTTLFDVINGFNYVLCHQKSANIRVVNASWICLWDEPLLKQKIEQLLRAGVFVVAAAGNSKQTAEPNLDLRRAYPACYSQELPNVITATTVRKSYIPHQLVSRQGDSVISGLLNRAIETLGLFDVLETGDDVLGSVLPTAGYVAVENYSTTYVNVGVVSTFGYFRSPFWTGKPIRGSSFACALVTAFVIAQLGNRTDLLPTQDTYTPADMEAARQQLLAAMSGVDDKLSEAYVQGGYYLSGYEVA